MTSARAPRFTLLAPLLVTALAAAFTLRRIDDFDVWYHLAAGRLMWSTGRWPVNNTFSFTAADHPWIDLHWIFQLLLYGAYGLAGMAGCTLLAVALMVATVGLLYANARRSAPPLVVAVLLAIALAVASPRFVPRPELMSFVLFALYLWLLDDYPRSGRAIWALVPLQALWTNAQGIFAIGLALIGCHWLGAALAFLPLPRGWRETNGVSRRDFARLTLVLVAAAAVCFLNPYGIEGVRFPLQLFSRVTGGSIFSARIGEFRAPFESGYAPTLAWTWAALLAATGLSFLPLVTRLHLGRLFAAVAFGYLSTQALRNMALFAWIAVPTLAANLGGLLARVPARSAPAPPRVKAARGAGTEEGAAARAGVARRAAEGAAVAALVGLTLAVATNRFSHAFGMETEFGLGVSRLHFPTDAVAFARTVGLSGRPFNCLAMGGYLAWERFPGERVFVDGRLETYPESFFRVYFRALDDPQIWPQLAARYELDYALLYDVWPNRHSLVRYLAAGHGWEMVYYDETASLFVPTDDAHAPARERARRAFAEILARRAAEPLFPDVPGSLLGGLSVPVQEIRRQTAYGDFLGAMGLYAEAARAYERALRLDPDAETRFALGMAYWRIGEPDRAVREWRDLLRRHPEHERARQALTEATASGAGG